MTAVFNIFSHQLLACVLNTCLCKCIYKSSNDWLNGTHITKAICITEESEQEKENKRAEFGRDLNKTTNEQKETTNVNKFYFAAIQIAYWKWDNFNLARASNTNIVWNEWNKPTNKKIQYNLDTFDGKNNNNNLNKNCCKILFLG